MTITRRRFIRDAGVMAAGAVSAPGLIGIGHTQQRTWRAGDPFSLGVASGSPQSDGFVLWTRLAPKPLSADTDSVDGMSGEAVTLAYEIADDPSMRRIVKRGGAIADPRYGYSVHAEITGLEAGRSYWYRFLSGEATSRVGRAAWAAAGSLAFRRSREISGPLERDRPGRIDGSLCPD